VTPPRRERKVVSVLFADLVGFTARAEALDPEDVEAILRPYHERLRTELERFGGTVEKFIGDAVMALFGAPVAHEDDPERAVRAALAIRDWAREEGGVQVRVAVNTGEAVVNLDARPNSGEGMAAGDVVNTTARLQSAAPVNGVLVGETTYRVTRDVITYGELEPIAAKGKAEPVPVWEAVESRSRVGTETVSANVPLVGRERELDQLVDALTRVRTERSPQLVTIIGVPGIGKSRLVAELYAIADADSEIMFWRHGRSLPYGDGVTFWAVGEMVKAQAGILETDPAEEAAEKLRSTIAELVDESERETLEANLRPLVGLAREDEGGGDRLAESFAAWRRFFEALGERRPLVLAFEDLHWADDDLLDFVDELVDWVDGVPLLVLCTARPELLDRRSDWGGGKRNAATISLRPLDTDDTARLIGELLERSVLPAEVQAALLARAEGNPLYAEQFVRRFVERGGGMELPVTVHGIIAARLDSLGPIEKALLQDAAVFGKAFWTGALAALGGVGGADVERSLRPLARREFVRRARRTSVAGETQYEFGHVLVRDVAYGQIPRSDRAAKHLAAAKWIETLAPDRSEDRAEMLAHHYLAAIEFARTGRLDVDEIADPARLALREAAERAATLGSYRQALRFYDAALELWPDGDPEQSFVALRRADVLFDFGEFPEVEELAQLAERFEAMGRRDAAAEAEMLRAKTAWATGREELVDVYTQHASELLRDAPDSPTKAIVLVERGRLKMLAAEWDEARTILGEGLLMAERFGLERLYASGLITLGTIPPEDVSSIERGTDIAVRLNDVGQIQRGYNNLAEVSWRLGRIAGADDAHEAARRSTQRLGGRELLRWLDAVQGMTAYATGDWDRALEYTRSFFGRVDSARPHYMDAAVRVMRGHIRFARGDHEQALADVEASVAEGRRGVTPQTLTVLQFAALLYIDADRSAEADELLTLSLAAREVLYHFGLDGALAMAELGRFAELAELAERLDLTEVWLAIIRALAAEDYAAAADVYGDLELRTYEARARLRLAERLHADGDRSGAVDQARSALAFYEAVRAKRFVERLEAVLPVSA
jgi:class 3 adenylate cyclase/tetratricopeptide (TPR) repeat protein